MPKIIIDKELCTRCKLCSAICLMGIIKPASDTEYPLIPGDREGMCMRCGHCEAFCPHQALVLDYRTEEKIRYAEEDGTISPERLVLYMHQRRSIRHFMPGPVSRDTIKQILQVARYAPTGGNSQTVEWLVVYDTAKVKHIASLTVDWMRSIQGTPHPMAMYVPEIIKAWEMGFDPICHNAPHLVFAHLPFNEFIDDRTDAIIALAHFDLAAPAFGVGACWAGFIRMAFDSYIPLQEALALPDRRRIGYGLFFGYPKLSVKAIPRREELKLVWT